MPVMKNYIIEVEVTVKIRDSSNNRPVLSIDIVETGKANSYDPDHPISIVTNRCIRETSRLVWDHMLVVENQESEKD